MMANSLLDLDYLRSLSARRRDAALLQSIISKVTNAVNSGDQPLNYPSDSGAELGLL